jgi:hypothetical protein
MPRAVLIHEREPPPHRIRGVILDDSQRASVGLAGMCYPWEHAAQSPPALHGLCLPSRSSRLLRALGLVDGLGHSRPVTERPACLRQLSRLASQTGASMVFTVLAWGFVAFVVLVFIGLIWLSLLNQRDEARSKKAAFSGSSPSPLSPLACSAPLAGSNDDDDMHLREYRDWQRLR